MASSVLIDLEPIGRRIEVPAGLTLLEAAQQAGVDLVAACGGMGICGTCRVRLVNGPANPLTPSEEEQLTPAQLAEGGRLACQCVPQGDLKLEVPPESLPAPQKMQTEGRSTAVDLQPAVRPLDLTLPAPALDDLRSDWTRLQQALPPGVHLSAGLTVLSQLSTALRQHDWSVRLAISESCEPGPASQSSPLLTGFSSGEGRGGEAARQPALTSPPAPSLLHGEGRLSPDFSALALASSSRSGEGRKPHSFTDI